MIYLIYSVMIHLTSTAFVDSEGNVAANAASFYITHPCSYVVLILPAHSLGHMALGIYTAVGVG